MAKHKPQHKATNAQTGPEMQLVGTEEVFGTFADVFVVTNETETHTASLYFYQRQLSTAGSTRLGETQTYRTLKAKCFARIILSEKGIEKLLEALADNRGFTLTPKTKEQR